MNSKIIKFAVLPALLIALIIFIFAHSQTSTTNIVVAKNNIQAGTRISDDDLSTVKFPAGMVPQGAIRNKKDAVGHILGINRTAGDLMLQSCIGKQHIDLSDNEVLIALTIDPSIKDYVSEGTILTVDGLSGASGNVPAQIIDDLPVVAIVSNSGDNKNTIAIVKTDKDKAVALAPFLKGGYVVMIQK